MKFCSAKRCGVLGIKCYDWKLIQMLAFVVVLIGVGVWLLASVPR